MDDRLAQIWNGFADSTARSLANTSIDNIPRPDHDSQSEMMSLNQYAQAIDTRKTPVPEDITPPAQAAFATLRAKLASMAAQPSGKAAVAPEAAPPNRPEITRGTNTHVSANLSAGYDRLQQDLKSTEQLTTRREVAYLASAADLLRASAQKKTKSKGFFGFFRKK